MYSNGFKYQLEPYKGTKSRFTCPNCGAKNNFAKYIDVDGNYLGDDFGRCNSEISCAYHKKPDGNGIIVGGFVYQPTEPTFLRDEDVFVSRYQDTLYDYLVGLYSPSEVQEVFDKYIVRSTNKKWHFSTVFYQKDINGRFRTGKIIQYDDNGHRVKYPYSHIYWVHNLITDFEFYLEQCLFGEHLLESFDSTKGNIYLVESEKTCLIASLYYKKHLFIATGGLSNLNVKKLSVLKGYDVEAIPDKGGYDYWKEKLEPLGITVNTALEKSDLPDGSDLADLLINSIQQ
jgi:hypothetical protein